MNPIKDNNIDQLLKDSFNNFEASPPTDAWSAIQHNLPSPANTVVHSVASKAASVVKSASILTKVALITATSGVLAGGTYFVYQKVNQKAEPKTTQTSQPTNVVKAPAVQNEEKINNSEIVTTPSVSKNNKTEKSSTRTINSVENNIGTNEKATSENYLNNQTDNISKTNSTDQVKKPEPQINKSVPPVIKPKHQFNEEEKTVANNLTEENNVEKPFIPNVITPNNDGQNDRFEITIQNEEFYELKIFDLNHKLVFTSNNKEKMWDGTMMNSGEYCAEGRYYFELNYQYKNTKKAMTQKGFMEIIR